MGKEKTARILRIEKISPNDGVGLRTVVFFKGCSLRCRWCSTPESQNMHTEIFHQAGRCVLCQRCIEVCKEEALYIGEKDGAARVHLDRERCDGCLRCVDACPQGALGSYGREMSVEQVMKIIRRDEVFYYHSGGGVTLSGGDVLRQADLAREILAACKDSAIHTMAELDMYGSYSAVEKILPYLDAFYVDIKCMDDRTHREWTGVSNESILENTRRAAHSCRAGALHVRVPLIPGVNDSRENIIKTAAFCESLENCAELEFLPYHRLGQSTYGYLGRDYLLKDVPAMTSDEAYGKAALLKGTGLLFPVKVSGKII